MLRKTWFRLMAGVAMAGALGIDGSLILCAQTAVSPAKMPKVGTIDERFQSFNIEMVEVTGGRFWAPYKKQSDAPVEPSADHSAPAGMDPSAFRYRAPLNLANPKLRKLATGLAPSYMRVSGTWENTTYFHDSDDAAPATPPTG